MSFARGKIYYYLWTTLLVMVATSQRDQKQQTDSIQQDDRYGNRGGIETGDDCQHSSSSTGNAASKKDSVPSRSRSNTPHTEAPCSVHVAMPDAPPTFSPPEEEILPLPEPPLESDNLARNGAESNEDEKSEKNKPENIEAVQDNEGKIKESDEYRTSTPDTISEGKNDLRKQENGSPSLLEDRPSNADDDDISVTPTDSSPDLQSQAIPADELSKLEEVKETTSAWDRLRGDATEEDKGTGGEKQKSDDSGEKAHKGSDDLELGPDEEKLSGNVSSSDQSCTEDSCSQEPLKVGGNIEEVGNNSNGGGRGDCEGQRGDEKLCDIGDVDKDAAESGGKSFLEEKEASSSTLEVDAEGQAMTGGGTKEVEENVAVATEEEKEETLRPEEEEKREDKESVEDDDQVLTFEEFKKKLMEEGGGQVQRPPDSGGTVPAAGKKATLTNYASVDCGAKVVEANPEALNTMAILDENRDVYMINPCKANISFVVELCEMVSVRTIEIACFELFSSIPKKFKVYTSESLSEGEWLFQGEFEVPNERAVHPKPLATDNHVYAKFVKIEMVSHYGQEHYCPLSLLRVLGASMMEVYEESRHNSRPPASTLPPSEGFGEEDLLRPSDDSTPGVNGTLLDAAKDAVMSVLNRPLKLLNKVNGLMKSGQGKQLAEEPPQDLSTQDNPGLVPSEGGISSSVDVTTGKDEQGMSEGVETRDESQEEEGSEKMAETSSNDKLSDDGDGVSRTDDVGEQNCEEGHSCLPTDMSEQSKTRANDGSPNTVPMSATGPLPPATTSTSSDQISAPASGGVASGQPETSPTVLPTHTASVADSVRPTPLDDAGPRSSPQPVPGEPGLGPDLGPTDQKNGSETLVPGMADSEEGKGQHDQQKKEDPMVGVSNFTDDKDPEGKQDPNLTSESHEKNHKEYKLNSEIGETTIVKTEDDSQPVSEDQNQKFSNNAGPSNAISPGDTVPRSNTQLHPDDSGNSGIAKSNRASTSPEELDDAGKPSLISPNSTSNGDSKSISSAGAAPASVTNDASADDSLDGTNATRSSNALELESGNEKGQLSDSNVANASSTDSSVSSSEKACDNGNQTNSHSNGNSNIGDSKSVPVGQNGTSHINNGAQVESNNTITRNGNQTAATGTHSGSDYKGISLPKERSVFLLLSNHIEELDSNMTLFSIFLDNISSSLKKNKNKTDETSRMLERRINSLNSSIAALSEELTSRRENISELRDDLLDIVEGVANTFKFLSRQREEVLQGIRRTLFNQTHHKEGLGYLFLAELTLVLLLLLTIVLLLSLLWQCRSQAKLRKELQSLQMTLLASSALAPGKVESGERPSSAPSQTPRKQLFSSLSSRHSRSSSVSSIVNVAMLSNRTRNGIGAASDDELSLLNGKRVTTFTRHQTEHAPQSSSSLSTSSHQETSKEQEWIISTDKKKRKSKPRS